MLLVLEIWLTVKAWQAGWKAWALLPVGCIFTLGMIMGAAEVDMDTIAGIGLFGDIAAIMILGVMAAVKPAAQEDTAPESAAMEDGHAALTK